MAMSRSSSCPSRRWSLDLLRAETSPRAISRRTPATRRNAVTGALAVATAAVLPGTVASRFVEPRGFSGGVLAIEHPTGRIEVDLVTDRSGPAPVVERAILRSHRAAHF